MGGRAGFMLALSGSLALALACAASDEDSEIVDVRTPAADTDEAPAGTLRSASGRIEGVVWRARGDGASFAVSRDGKLWKVAGGRQSVLLDRATGRPAVLPNGDVVVARGSDEPGETDLWLVPDGGSPRALAAAPGPDDSPIALPDGRVAFVSARTTIASLWIVDPRTDEARQLTNRGLVAGGARVSFVPPPLEPKEVTAEQLTYDAGDGEIWRVDLTTGRGLRLPGARR